MSLSHLRGGDLSHELKPWGRKWGKADPFWDIYDRLIQFGYGTPGVKV